MVRPKVTKTKSFETAVYEADYDVIVDLAAQHRSKKNSFSFCEELKHINENELNKLMKQLLKMLIDQMEKNFDKSATVDWTTLSSEQCKSTAHFIQAATDVGLACMQCGISSACRVELAQIAVFLHGIMLPMPDTMDYVKNFISLYCEKLISSGNSENCEIILTNVVLYLVRRTLVKKANKNAVKRLYGIRKILTKVLAQDGPDAAQLWSLFVDCAVSRIYLESFEGIKVIALVMSLDPVKVLEIHEKIKLHLPSSSIKCATSYGNIYFEAWCYTVKSGNDKMKDIIEVICIQQVIVMGIQAEQKHILPLVRKVLKQFCIHKKEQRVSKMLYSVYRPIIWRYLKNPNGLYRAGAGQLFLDIFPLEDPDMRVVENDMELNDQLLMIQDLLLDDFPIVRITAVIGVCVSMSVNWEVFPEEMLRTFFRIIVNELSRDSATPEVRIAVVKGIKCLLENALIVESLFHILPKLAGLFHDTDQNVRIAFCQLLLKVKKISSIKYFDIVPISHLFARLEEDCHAVKKCITNLLHNSYFPKGEDPKVWLGRCLEILRTERNASRVFFSYVSSFIGVDQSVKFMIQAVKAVHFYVKAKSCSSHLDMKVNDKDNVQNFTDYTITLEDAVGFRDLNIVSTVIEAVAIMWLSLKPDAEGERMDDYKKTIKMLVGKLGTSLSELCLYYKDTDAWESIFYLSSFLPPLHVPSLASLCFMKLKNLSPDAEPSAFMTLLECLANHCQMKELLNIIKQWIEAGLNGSFVSMPPPAKKIRKRGKKNSEGIHQNQMLPYLGNRMLYSIFNHRNLQKHALLARSALLEILYLSDNVKRKIEKDKKTSEAEAEFLNLLIYNMLVISVHFCGHPDSDQTQSIQFVNEFVQWTSDKLLKGIAPVKNKTNDFTSLIIKICESHCRVLGDVTSLEVFEDVNCSYLDFIYLVLDTDFGYKILFIASKFLFKHAATSQYRVLMNKDYVMIRHNLRYLSKIFQLINNEAMLEKLSETEIGEITFILANVMQIANNFEDSLAELTSQAFKSILKNILDCSAAKCTKIVEEMAEDPFDRLSFPTTGNFFWSIISLKPKLFQTYIKYLIDEFKNSQDLDISHWIAYWMITWSFLNVKSLSIPVVKDINRMVLQLEKHIHNLYPRKNDSCENNNEDSSKPVPLELFQHHCHTELIKLKNRIKSKLSPKLKN